MKNVAEWYTALQRPTDRLKVIQDVLMIQKDKLGSNHLDTIGTIEQLVQMHTDLLQYEDAHKLCMEMLPILKGKAGPVDDITGLTISSLVHNLAAGWASAAENYSAMNRHADAETHYGWAMELYTGLIPKNPNEKEHLPNVLNVRNKAAMTAAKLGAVHLLWTRKFDQAEARFAEAVRLDEHPAIYFSIGEAYARNGQWKKAAAAYERGLGLNPPIHTDLYYTAALHLGADDTESYRRVCKEMIDRFCTGPDTKPVIAERTIKACTLVPGAVADFGVVEKLAQSAVTGTERHPAFRYFAWAKGLAEYRAGRPAVAIEWLERFAPKSEGISHDATVFAALAMAKHRVGQVEEAKASLAKAKTIVAEKMPDPAKGRQYGDVSLHDGWLDWLHAEILIREAEGVLKEKAGDKKPALKKPD